MSLKAFIVKLHKWFSCSGNSEEEVEKADCQIEEVKEDIKNHSVLVRRKLTRVQTKLKSIELVVNNKK